MSGERILVVDDGKENRDFIVEYVLEPNGFEALVARDGREGLEMARRYMPDLILLDLQMPYMDGMEVLDALNAEQLDIPVILMTFHGSEEIAVEVYRRGVKDYVRKPYTVEDMYDAINRSMTEVRLRRDKDQLTERLIKANADLNQRVRELNVLYGIGKSVTALTDIDQLMMRVAEAAARLTGCEESSVYLLEDDELRCKSISRQADQRTYKVDEVRHDELAVRAIQSGDLVVLSEEEITAARRNNPSAPSSAMAMPLMIQGRAVGALVAKNLAQGARLFTRNDGALLSALSDYAAVAYDNAVLHRAALGQKQPAGGAQNVMSRAVVTDVLNQLKTDPDNLDGSGKRIEISAIGANLRGYQLFAKKAPPEQIVPLLNEYLDLTVEIIFRHQGTLDQISGDAIMAIFNSPTPQANHPELAAITALRLQAAVLEKNQKQGGGLLLGMGLHIGPAVVGYFGVERAMNYTAVGETISITQNLQLAAKPGQILISETMLERLGSAAAAEPLGRLPIQGSDDGIEVFELQGFSMD